MKVALICPAGMFTDAGSWETASLLLFCNRTLTPATPAGPVRVRVPVAALPPITVEGFTARLASDTVPTGITVSGADCEIEAYTAVMVTVSTDVAPAVVIGTVAEVCPLEMVTNCGTDATVDLLLEKCTVARLAAGLPRVTIPVNGCPLITESLLSENAKGGLTVSVAVFAVPPKLAEIVTV